MFRSSLARDVEFWWTRRLPSHFGSAVARFAWKNRAVGKASSIYADGKMIILNENGKLFLAKVSPAELEILSEVQLCDDRTWTVPTLVGTTLYARDRERIVALDLGAR